MTSTRRWILAVSLLTASAACGDDEGSSGGGGGSSTSMGSAGGTPAGAGGGAAQGGSGPSGTGGSPGAGGAPGTGGSGGAGTGGGEGGGAEVAGCRAFPVDPPSCDYEAPIVIDDDTPDEGGVVVIRDRCFRQPETIALSADGNVTEPAIRIRTERPVLLENVITVSAGSHVFAEGFADVTIRRSAGYGLEPTVDDVPRGTYLTMEGFNRVTVERSFLTHTRGLQLWSFDGDDAGERTIRIVKNVVRNVDGRCRNTGSGACGNDGNYQFANFVGFNDVRGAGIEIAWNDVENQPNESSVEDNLGLYRAAGTAELPMTIHHNAIRGGWEYPVSDNYTGSCFTTDGDPETVAQVGYIEATRNLCIGLSMNIAGGHDVHFRDNVYASSGQLPDGTPMTQCFWCIGGIYDYYDGGSLVNDSIEDLLYGLPAGYDGAWVAENGNPMTVEKMPEPVTLATEAALVEAWCDEVAAAGVVLGP